MKQTLFLLVAFLGLSSLYAQKPTVTWGETFKIKQGSVDLEVFHSDKSGVYMEEEHNVKRYFAIASNPTRGSARLVKLDKSLTEVYNVSYNRELKGKSFLHFFCIREKLYMFALDDKWGSQNRIVYGVEIDKLSGQLLGTWKEMATIAMREKHSDFYCKVVPNVDSTKLVVVSAEDGSKKNIFRLQLFDQKLKAAGSPTEITKEYEKNTYDLEGLIYYDNNTVVAVGRVYEYREGKKKKSRFLDFSEYSIRVYDHTGKQINEISAAVDGVKWLTSTKVSPGNENELVLTAFYTTNRKDKTIDGLIVQRVNPFSGEVLSNSDYPISKSMFSVPMDDEDDPSETKEEKAEKEMVKKSKSDGEDFSAFMKFREIYHTDDGGIVILAEKYKEYIKIHTRVSDGRRHESHYQVLECGEIMICKVDQNANIDWLKVLPKAQREVYFLGVDTKIDGGIKLMHSYFELARGPYYSSFGSMMAKNNLLIFFNDLARNTHVIQPGQSCPEILIYNKAHCNVVTVDVNTAKLTRRFLFDNAGIPTALPSRGSVIGNEMYIVGQSVKLFSKNKTAVGKITVRK